MLHVPLSLDFTGQWWENVLQLLAHLCILTSYYQTYGSVSPVQATYGTKSIVAVLTANLNPALISHQHNEQ